MKSGWEFHVLSNAGSYNHLPFIFLSDNNASCGGLISTITNFISGRPCDPTQRFQVAIFKVASVK